MKKCFKLMIVLISFFAFFEIANAGVCDNNDYACISCTYSEDTFHSNITYTLISDGSNIKLTRDKDSWEYKKNWIEKSYYTISYDELTDYTLFITNGKLECLDSIYIASNSGTEGSVLIKKNSQNSQIVSEAKLISSENNKKNIYDSNSEKLYTCPAKVFNKGTSATGNVAGSSGTVTLTSNGYTIRSAYFSNPAYELVSGNYSDIAKEFTTKCPEIFVLCEKNKCKLLKYIPSDLTNAENIKQSEGFQLPISYFEPEAQVPEVTIPELNCTSLLGSPTQSDPPSPAFLLTYAFKILRYVAIILMFVLTVMDFINSVTSNDTDSLKKAVSKTIKRAVLCVVIFLLPMILEYVLNLLYNNAVKICINT